MNRNGIISPAAELPVHGTKMRVSTQNGLLTIEFERSCSWLQFNKVDACAFIQGLSAYVKAME
jgi:hypothetical protein